MNLWFAAAMPWVFGGMDWMSKWQQQGFLAPTHDHVGYNSPWSGWGRELFYHFLESFMVKVDVVQVILGTVLIRKHVLVIH